MAAAAVYWEVWISAFRSVQFYLLRLPAESFIQSVFRLANAVAFRPRGTAQEPGQLPSLSHGQQALEP